MLSVTLIVGSLRLLWAVSPLRGHVPGHHVAVLLLASYPIVDNLGSGQNAALWLALWTIGARLLLAGRELSAGAVLGLGALKPQLFLAAPVLFIARRQWRALRAWSLVAGILGAGSVGLVGIDGTRAYVELLTSDLYRDGVAVPLSWKMLSLPALGRALTPDAVAEPAALILFAAGLLALGWTARRASLPTTISAAVLVSVMVNPHGFLYDGLVLAVPLLLRPAPPTWLLSLLWLGMWSAPLRADLDSPASAPWVALPLAGMALLALATARRESSNCTAPA